MAAEEQTVRHLRDRREAFKHYAEHYTETFRSDLYEHEEPRQFAVMGVGLAMVAYLAVSRPPESDLRADAQRAVLALAIIVGVYSATQLRDSLMVRPHPMIWRIIHGLNVLYLGFLCILLMLDLEGARNLIKLLSPQAIDSFKPSDPFAVPNVNQCDISYDNVMRQLTSPWMVSHFFGWVGKMCLFRDVKYCMVSSLMFELAELSLQFIIPEFKECWWDSIFIDFLGANLLGILAGNALIKFLNSRSFAWLDEDVRNHHEGSTPASPKKSPHPHIDRFVDSLMPFSWSEYRWQFFSTFSRFMAAVVMTVVQLGLDLNAFFLLHMLQIPVSNKLNHLRLLLVITLAFPATSEWYEHTDKQLTRLGPNFWLLIAILNVEWLLVLKCGSVLEQFQRLPPMIVMGPWLAFLGFVTLFVVFYYQSRQRAWLNKPLLVHVGPLAITITRTRVLALLHACAVLPLVTLAVNWKY